MKQNKLISLIIMGLMFISINTLIAQEKPVEKETEHSMMQDKDMHKCMDKIASDEHMRSDMMGKMMKETDGDSSGMMQMCKMMMDNPDMMKMMMKMMHGEGGMMEGNMMNHGMMKSDSTGSSMMKDNTMKMDSTKTMKKSEHKKHH